ncbi:MAG: peptidylprolyl isomerase [Planctomycetia bacterium]|nr:peptidylprolyl isomerase [Planctomycetia bacterium]
MYKKYWPEEKALREKQAKEDLPLVRLKTTKGDIVLELFKDEAPNAVGNFLTLVDKGFYKDVPFHRVLPYFMAQGGDPTGSGAGGPGYCIPCECRQENARKHFRGSISMAHAGPDTGGSQFFLTFVPTFFLNNQHTVFGRVVEGMNVLSELQRIDPEGENLPAPDKILDAKIERGKPFSFKKLPSR